MHLYRVPNQGSEGYMRNEPPERDRDVYQTKTGGSPLRMMASRDYMQQTIESKGQPAQQLISIASGSFDMSKYQTR